MLSPVGKFAEWAKTGNNYEGVMERTGKTINF